MSDSPLWPISARHKRTNLEYGKWITAQCKAGTEVRVGDPVSSLVWITALGDDFSANSTG
ncbi:hypothetical protein CC1G_14070 [Coprinopsis cinerea okayama7|uniref:Uncharacterized protein n=1 Tax=Coprinopsis cinerea (strain Okayama-7 / 130 / ATCC MYA-4618 / FGSC 9003) TaxID=240176 RepID=D6RL43_COPC7|nr:hypothetical protein CC1G_14070 [Coprinopsis cinerea okayama7\|eukprot:XP_002911538.1 hypothetical protein CC1G_14070 [Coprinopsis cinerea okayama7\